MKNRILTAILLLCMVLSMCACGGNASNSESGTEGSQSSTQTESVDDTQSNTQFGTQTEMGETEATTETEADAETEESESQSENESTSSGTQNSGTQNSGSQNSGNGNTSTQQPESETPSEDIIGMGTSSNPYYETPNVDNMTVVTVSIPAGQTIYYNIYRVGGMWFAMDDADLYVVDSDGKRHDEAFAIEEAMASEAVSFQIGNKGTTAKTFTLRFTNMEGSYQNPAKLTSVGPHSKHLEANDEAGYYYSYKAAQTGVLRIYMTATEKTEMNVQNNSGAGTVARSFTADVQTDDQGREYIELNVNSGDEIRIHVQAVKPTRGKRPATDITFEFAYH